jgi:hypothetical protein
MMIEWRDHGVAVRENGRIRSAWGPILGLMVVLWCAVPGAGFGSEVEAAEELRQRALEDNRAWNLVAALTSEVGPRPAGSVGDRRAVAWAVEQMEAMGFENVRAEPVTVPSWEAGITTGRIVTPHPQELRLTALGGSVGTPEDGIEAEVIEVASQEELMAMSPDRLAGKIVFVNHRMERKRDGSDYGKVVMGRGFAAWTASDAGAIAVVIRSVGTGNHRFPHTGGMFRHQGSPPPIPAAALAIPDADILEYQLRLGEPVRLHLEMTSRSLADAMSANVIGEVVGSERPDEIVLLVAHLDSWGLGTGAIDDGAGCAITMAAATLIAELPVRPKRTIRVLLAANEEFGLSGAKAYAETYRNTVEQHYVALESDFGAGRIWSFDHRFGAGGADLGSRIQSVLAKLDVAQGNNDATGGADLSPLRAHKVPVIDLNQDGTDYFDYHHSDDDTLDKIDPEALRQNVAAVAVTAYLAAQADEVLRPIPDYPPAATPFYTPPTKKP